MQSHLLWLTVFAACVSIVFAALQRDEPRAQLTLAGKWTAGFVATALAMAWILRLFPLGT